MKFDYLTTDSAVLAEIGKRVAQLRIDKNITQKLLAEKSGVGKTTIERLERGQSVQLANFISILKVLDLLPAFDKLLPDISVTPMEALYSHEKKRKRASSLKVADSGKSEWHWGEDE